MDYENAIVVVNKTRLEALVERFNTRAQARFYIEHSGGSFEDYEDEHQVFHRSLETVVRSLQGRFKVKVVERKFIPTYLFSGKDLIVVIGQDGLVANTAKYASGLPMLTINPDETRNDGILLQFNMKDFEYGWRALVGGSATFMEASLAEARTNDGQRLLAFNDLFIGPASHTSARYKITYQGMSEQQSSSGIIVSTGAGSSGWLSSLFNMANGMARVFAKKSGVLPATYRIKWDIPGLVFVVREPFLSRHSSIQIAAGAIVRSDKLLIESFMPSNGVIFSDGIESDFIQFNCGAKVEVGVAAEKARLVENRGNW